MHATAVGKLFLAFGQEALSLDDELPAYTARTLVSETDLEQVLEELASENLWQQQFRDSQDMLKVLADEALSEHKAGKTKDFDLNQ